VSPAPADSRDDEHVIPHDDDDGVLFDLQLNQPFPPSLPRITQATDTFPSSPEAPETLSIETLFAPPHRAIVMIESRPPPLV
jgi:hypothetical protein